MDTTKVIFQDKEYSLYDVRFVILWKWHQTGRDKNTLIELLNKYTPMTDEECTDWVVELRPPDILEWSKTELGKEITTAVILTKYIKPNK